MQDILLGYCIVCGSSEEDCECETADEEDYREDLEQDYG